MTDSEVRIVPVDEAPWADVELVFGTRGDPSTCWCQFFKLTNEEFKTASRDVCRDALRDQVATLDPPPGVVAYRGDEAVGWCAVEPRVNYPRVLTSRVIDGSEEPLSDAGVWAITCFVVRVGHRRQGIGGNLLAGAVDQARRHGARVIEGYPVDTAGEKSPSADLYHGTLTQFLRAGFELVAIPSPHRAVVRLVA
ncbi:GNAT family N-acetyltransferase [Glaciibacter flavus]|uniref:GNAT family N-acetyltransferase n=1 Tax=Orlajensenia flava TaxID=2565934 RepID=A0A4V3WUE0_9MICO|nr:GNAT family N-acetyltransferase [Glaciibacter flavus]THG35467.1 GNAT family N-acetyltransferase [Glaciibacter flavus]